MCRTRLNETLWRKLPTLWIIPDPMWRRIQPVLPDEKAPGTPGRSCVPFRDVLNGILFVLRTGI